MLLVRQDKVQRPAAAEGGTVSGITSEAELFDRHAEVFGSPRTREIIFNLISLAS
jgi:hypothetical protein